MTLDQSISGLLWPSLKDPILALLRRDSRLVYFVQCEDEFGPVKIGISDDVQRRLADLQSCNPYPLRLLTVISGGLLMEQALHKRFGKWRRNGEWFSYSAELRTFVEALIAAQHAEAS